VTSGTASRFIAPAADQARLPVLLLSGFLGSGKTTLVNALLRDERLSGTAVAVNEFGPVPLDRDLIDHGEDRTVVMANGCLCCNLAGDMDQAVMRLFSRREDGSVPRFNRLLIEPSGLSDPAPIAQALLRNPVLSRAFRLEGIVTTVDAVFGAAQLDRHAETRRQVTLADTIVITKPDLAGAGAVTQLRTAIRRLNPAAPIELAEHGAVPIDAVLPPGFLGAASASLRRMPPFAEAADHLATIGAASLTADRPLRWTEFDLWLRGVRIRHAEQLMRLKGILSVAGEDRPIVVQGVHHVMHAPVVLDAWPGADHSSRLVVIADKPTAEAIRADWAAALPGLVQPH
jgi:G3E family GTPase